MYTKAKLETARDKNNVQAKVEEIIVCSIKIFILSQSTTYNSKFKTSFFVLHHDFFSCILGLSVKKILV
jgi:hypothetical protein